MTVAVTPKATGRPKDGYRLADGTKIPGTTTVISRFKDSGALMFWAFKQGKEGKAKLYDDAEKAADIGTYAHELVRAWLRGEEPATQSPLDADGTTKALTAFNAFLEWASQTRLNVIETEVSLVSEKYRFGGTLDAVGFVGDALCLLDWKCANGIYTDYLLQLAAYKHLWETAHPDQKLQAFHLLRFSKDFGDFSHHFFGQLDDAWQMFTHLRAAYDLDRELKKRV